MKVWIAVLGISIVLSAFTHMYVTEVPKCPQCGSTLVWTPLGTKSENFLWRCLLDGTTWRKTYPKHVFENWKRKIPHIVRDASIEFLLRRHPEVRALLPGGSWKEDREGQKYRFTNGGWNVIIEFTPDMAEAHIVSDYTHQGMGIMHRIIWVADFHNGDFVELSYTYAV